MLNPSRKMKPMFPATTNIVMVWSMVFIGLIIYALIWFTFGAVAMTYIDAISDNFTFDPPWDNVVTLSRNVILWHPVISMFGWILWGFLNSMRRDVRTWEV